MLCFIVLMFSIFVIMLFSCYADFMFVLCWWYYYVLFIAYIWIDKIYDIYDIPLSQMVIQCTAGVNTKDEDVEDDEDD